MSRMAVSGAGSPSRSRASAATSTRPSNVGSSLRVSATRDVALEGVKDAAIAIYSRDGAMRVTDRRAAIGDFHAMTKARAAALADTYALDYLLTEQALRLPLVHAEGPLKLYRLGPQS